MNVAIFSDSRLLAERHADTLRDLLGWDTSVSEIDALLEREPDVLLFDFAAPLVACGVLRLIRFRHVATPAALIVHNLDAATFHIATALGITGILHRDRPPILLADCLGRVAAGKQCIDASAFRAAAAKPPV